MDKLPAELLFSIVEASSTFPELLTYRSINRKFRSVVIKSGKNLAFNLLRSKHMIAFDDALLAIRLMRIPREACCHYDPTKGDYSFYPSADSFQAVKNGAETPPGFPSVPAASWYEEAVAAVDLYLLVLAWMSTTTCDTSHVDGQRLFAGGVLMVQVDEWA